MIGPVHFRPKVGKPLYIGKDKKPVIRLYSAEHWACLAAQKVKVSHKILVPLMQAARQKQDLYSKLLENGFGL